MTPPLPILRIRREQLARALRRPSAELRVLVLLLVRACPTTGRVWEPSTRLAETLDLPVSVVEDALHALSGLDLLEDHPTLQHRLRCVELGTIFVRSPLAPENLPVEPRSPPV